ncbi:MAG: hypothetical protein IPN65_01015 [Elusimicrobia bacterium]|nr:hypothetical protein [Elusimicrobiota bacterium]MBK7206945.1 hypothetical protein [Elusimicrobiota bacterium]MBK7545765.1 hypothetical protein [Elusimicrobiota bacterium]MBK7575029.1 hypothetical protein [Elusimicrobiota bacterium]MBK7687705.1 hypothetical protein [Elusimicrobiota bacterium]
MPDRVLHDKIQLLMDETGCERGQAELAMSLAGFDLEKAVRTIGTLLRDIVVVKGKFAQGARHEYGLVLLIADRRREHLFRARAVLSYNPALYETPLAEPWHEFERALYAGRLAEGTLQQASQDLERALVGRVESQRQRLFTALRDESAGALSGFLDEMLTAHFGRAALTTATAVDVVDVDQFRRLPLKSEAAVEAPVAPREAPLRLALEAVDDGDGPAAEALGPGDALWVRVVDPRDIGQYLARLLGPVDDAGPRPFEAPIEESFTHEGRRVLHVRLTPSVSGVVAVSPDRRLKARLHGAERWWRRLLPERPGARAGD